MLNAIELRDVGVRFDLHLSGRPRTIRSTLSDLLRPDRGRASGSFWALRHIDLSVARGEIVGLIGRNGAGKSTLLLVMAGILVPDAGRVWRAGRVSTVIGLGAGFDYELTGRENIYLNAALLGLSRKTIERRLNEIIEFSDLGVFIDAPLRTYSAGMRARLGFSVAAHIEPDILLIDEVLGAGDAAFQRKSRQKLEELMRKATMIVVATHDMEFVERHCTRAVWLDKGGVNAVGRPDDIVRRYDPARGLPRSARTLPATS